MKDIKKRTEEVKEKFEQATERRTQLQNELTRVNSVLEQLKGQYALLEEMKDKPKKKKK